ncbi:hypothetical protein P9477_23620 [Enterobacter mori]|uniref:hypothetical protein n=1 Tax=Enterobacter mori TaxID=539813 RepID=UPI00398AB2BE
MFNTIEKAKAIIVNAERIKDRNKDKAYDDRQDYNYTSYAWAIKTLRDVEPH